MKRQKSRNPNTTTSLLFVAAATVVILLIPAIAMKFSNEVKWDLRDFIIMGTLIFTAGLVYVFAAARTKDVRYRVLIGLCVVAVLFAIWAELAVGIFGTPFAGS